MLSVVRRRPFKFIADAFLDNAWMMATQFLTSLSLSLFLSLSLSLCRGGHLDPMALGGLNGRRNRLLLQTNKFRCRTTPPFCALKARLVKSRYDEQYDQVLILFVWKNVSIKEPWAIGNRILEQVKELRRKRPKVVIPQILKIKYLITHHEIYAYFSF
jgi:hypothetical protein